MVYVESQPGAPLASAVVNARRGRRSLYPDPWLQSETYKTESTQLTAVTLHARSVCRETGDCLLSR